MPKICNRCNRDLPNSSFSKDCKNNDGLRRRCRECESEYRRSKKPFVQKKIEEVLPSPVETVENRTSISRRDFVSVIEGLFKKYDSFVTITCNPSGVARLQVMGKYNIIHKVEDFHSLFEVVSEMECL